MIHGIAFTLIIAVVWPLVLWLWAKNRVREITRAREQTSQVAHDSVMRTIHKITRAREQTQQVAHDSVMRTIHKCETTVLMQKSQPTDAHKVSA